MKHKLFLFIATLGMLLPQVGRAQTLIDGIYYNLNSTDGTAEVTSNPDKYTGDIKVPETVSFEGKTYNVTRIGNFAFENCSNLTSITIPSSVKSIGEFAFGACSGLTSVTIPNGVESIGRYAFYYCSKLTSIIIPSSVKSIGNDTFSGCSNLTSITIPNGVESIGSYAFLDCIKLTSIIIPSSVKSIGNSAFENCTNLTSVTILNGVESIGTQAFEYCGKLTSVAIPSSVKSIGDSAFRLCGLTSLTIPDGVVSIGDYAFQYCGNLTSLTIPGSVDNIGVSAFGFCGLTSLTIPDGIVSIGTQAFEYCGNLTSLTIASSVKKLGEGSFFCCEGLTSIIVEAENPPSVGFKCFFCVDNTIPVYVPNSKYQAADGWKDFKNLILPTPYEIGGIYYNLLPGCTAEVTKHPDTYEGAIEIPETVSYEGFTFNVTGIGKEAFYGCANMTSIVIPGSVTSIGDKAFENCTSLTAITIPNRVESIGDNAFYYCKGITSITIPSSVKSIGSMAFGQCSGLTSMTVEAETPPSVGYECFFEVKSSIPVYVFSRKAAEAYKAAPGWSYFSNIVPPSTYKIGGIYYNLLPNGTAEVTENPNKYTGAIEIPKTVSSGGKTYNVTSIGEKAFYECEDLTSVTIPGSVTSIRENAFGYCSLPAIAIPGSVESIGDYAFQYCDALASITIPGSVVSIGDYAFQYCDALASITIPGSVESIGDYAFQYCSGLTSITIPSSVTSIGKSAFYECSSLTSITVEAETPASVGSECFFGVDKTIPVYVPSSTAAKVYRAADGWKEFTNIIYQYTFEDKTKYTVSKGFKADELIYTRTFSNTEWQALYVPFSMEYDEWKDKFDIAEIHNFIEYDDDDNGTVDRTYLVAIKKASGSTEPNYPYLIRAKETGSHTLALENKTLVAATAASIDCRSVKNEYTFTGTYANVTDMYAKGYYAMKDGALMKANASDVTLSAQRWYMNVTSRTGRSSSAKTQAIQILVDGEEGIENRSTSLKEESPVAYDLQGRMLSPFKGERGEGLRGINIVNGKKIIK